MILNLAGRAYAAETNSPGLTNLVSLKGIVSPISGSTNLQFRVLPGSIYKLLPTRDSTALFQDSNLHGRTLLVNALVREPAKEVEVVGNLHEIRDGKRFELFYYCEICSITTSFPGLCLCCREPVVLQEKEVQ